MIATRTWTARLAAALLIAATWTACSLDRYPLPQVAGLGETGFNAGDTTWLRLNKGIQLDAGSAPIGMYIDDDGHIFLADSAQGRILVYDQALDPLHLPGLDEFVLPGVRGVCVGPEQLLCAVAGDSALWTFNLAANREVLTSGLTGATLRNRQAGDTAHYDAAGIASLIADGSVSRYEFIAIDEIDLGSEEFQQRIQPRRMWDGSGSTRLVDVARGRAGQREIFLANANRSAGSRVNRVRLEPEAILFTENEEVPVVYLYRSVSDSVVVYPGTGVGTLDGILSLDSDPNGQLYLTQRAATVGAWKVQRMLPEAFAGIDYWSFDFGLQNRAIMETERFERPLDMTSNGSNIFVVDRHADDGSRVQVFTLSGRSATPLGATRVVEVDTLDVVDGVPLLDYRRSWSYDQLLDPRSVAVYGNRSNRAGNDDVVVYVVDGREVKLFMLSVSTSDLGVQ